MLSKPVVSINSRLALAFSPLISTASSLSTPQRMRRRLISAAIVYLVLGFLINTTVEYVRAAIERTAVAATMIFSGTDKMAMAAAEITETKVTVPATKGSVAVSNFMRKCRCG